MFRIARDNVSNGIDSNFTICFKLSLSKLVNLLTLQIPSIFMSFNLLFYNYLEVPCPSMILRDDSKIALMYSVFIGYDFIANLKNAT
jgi:hypothetical protein